MRTIKRTINRPHRPARRRAHALLLAAVLAAATVGCGSSDDGGKGGDTALTHALARVPAPLAAQSVIFRDVPAERRLVAANGTMYAPLAGYGIRELVVEHAWNNLENDYGFGERDIDTSLIVSETPTFLLTGTFDPHAVSHAMTAKHGYGVTPDNSIRHLSKSGELTMDVSDSVLIEHTSTSPTLPITPPAKSVADDDAYRSVADCLGDVYQASLYGKHAGHNKNIVLFGIGARTEAKNGSSETLCAVTASPKAADATAQALRDKETAPGKRYAGAKVTVGDGDTPVVSMTWQNKPTFGLRPGEADRDLELPGLLLNRF